jgi:hypothetical protein
MASGQRLISWLHPCSTRNVALNTRTCAHGPHMGHPNWAGCDTAQGSDCSFFGVREHDILTATLETPEHRGRVQGVSSSLG